MAYNVGQVEVTVFPNAKTFPKELEAQLLPQADSIGREIGDRMAARIQEKLRGINSPDVSLNVDTKKASSEVDRFLVDTKVKSDAALSDAGKSGGDKFAKGMQDSTSKASPLIMAAIGGGLIAGAPVAIAGAGVLFAGIAALAEKSNVQLKAAMTTVGDQVKATFQDAALVTVPMFTAALSRIGQTVQGLKPQFEQAFSALDRPIQSLTTGITALVTNAMPGIVAAIKNASPVFDGLRDLLARVGTGLSEMFTTISKNSGSAGQVFSQLGSVLRTLLDALGTLLSVGSQVGASILPMIVDGLRGVNTVLGFIAPVLPGVVAAFVGFKAVSSLSGPLSSFATALESAGTKAGGVVEKLTGSASAAEKIENGFGKAQGAASRLAQAMPVVSGAAAGLGFGLEIISSQMQKTKEDTEKWAQALLDGGKAADDVHQQYLNQFGGQAPDFLGKAAEALGFAASEKDIADKAKEMYAALGPAQRAQQDVTKAQNDYLVQVDKYGAASGQAAGAAADLRDKQEALTRIQGQLTSVTQTAEPVMSQNAARLQGIANMASQANSEINLFKGALDALTGKTISTDDAEANLTQAIDSATKATQGQTGALVDANGKLNLHSAAGAAAYQALKQVAGASNEVIGKMEEQGVAVDQVTARDGQLRDSFIKTAEKMGFSAGEAKNLANQIYGIPDERTTRINADTKTAANILSDLQAQIDAMRGKNIQITVSAQGGLATYTTDQRNLLYSGKATGGPIYGPGGPTDDKAGLFALSHGEWVVKAASSQKYGPKAMASINDGTAMVVPGLAGGGPVGSIRVNTNIDETSVDSMVASIKKQAATTFGAPAGGNAAMRALGQQIAANLGWASQFAAIDYVFSHESGWNPNAQNPTSTAYGIPQFLNSTWAAYGGKTSSPGLQITDGIRYMVDRFGSPNGAAAFWGAHHWYDQGGMVPPGYSNIYNGTGGNEHIGILTNPQWASLQSLASQRGETAATGGAAIARGPLVNVENQHIHSDVDMDLVLRQAEYRQRSGAFS